MEDDSPMGTNKLFQELHIPKVNMQFEILAHGTWIPRNLIVRNTCLVHCATSFVVEEIVSPNMVRAIAIQVFS